MDTHIRVDGATVSGIRLLRDLLLAIYPPPNIPLPGNATNATSAGGESSNSSSSDATREMIDQLFSRVPIESLVGYTAEFLLEMVHHYG